MKLFPAGRWLVLPITLLLGCRSEKAAFEFRPAPAGAVAVATMPPTAPAVAPAATVAVEATKPTAPARQAAAARPVAVQRANPIRQLQLQQKRETQRIRPRKAATQPQQTASGHAVFHIVLGSLLILGGVLTGLLLGGWLGLGVGAAVVILGYYFLVLGVGGKHAWLEIFQEFFNM